MKRNSFRTYKLFAAVISIASSGYLFGQDVHFSNMEYSPLSLNPALSGANSPMQAIVNYRNQWNSVATPYQTIAASFDARFNENNRQKSGILAGGISFFNDQAGELKVNTNTVNLNLSYHLILDRTSTLGLGMYGGFGQRSIDPNSARWSNQYDGSAYSASIGGEALNNSSFSYFDAGAGLLYAYDNSGNMRTSSMGQRVNIGVAAYHVNRPGYSYFDQNSEKLNMRLSAFVNAELPLGTSNGAILPGIYFQKQGPATEVLFGANYKLLLSEGARATSFSKPMSLSFGLFNRFKDALVAKVMFAYDQYSVGFAYDINISSLTEVSRANGGFELFLRYNMTPGPSVRSRIQ